MSTRRASLGTVFTSAVELGTESASVASLALALLPLASLAPPHGGIRATRPLPSLSLPSLPERRQEDCEDRPIAHSTLRRAQTEGVALSQRGQVDRVSRRAAAWEPASSAPWRPYAVLLTAAWAPFLSTKGNAAVDAQRLPPPHHPCQGAMVLMNAVCNKHTRPIDGSCCQRPRPPSPLQKLAACVFLGSALALLALHGLGYSRRRYHPHPRPRPVPPDADVESLEERKPATVPVTGPLGGATAALRALCRMGIIMAYFYLCDRADAFMKEQKHYTHATFFVPLVYVFVLGLFFSESSKETDVRPDAMLSERDKGMAMGEAVLWELMDSAAAGLASGSEAAPSPQVSLRSTRGPTVGRAEEEEEEEDGGAAPLSPVSALPGGEASAVVLWVASVAAATVEFAAAAGSEFSTGDVVSGRVGLVHGDAHQQAALVEEVAGDVHAHQQQQEDHHQDAHDGARPQARAPHVCSREEDRGEEEEEEEEEEAGGRGGGVGRGGDRGGGRGEAGGGGRERE
ncbi:hypothetical protein CRUP_008465 [Coryphaenoides rupestris]|nr:hypothetical protein CRUP_008465 [Coryphaenoides rupestris]